MPHNEVGPLYSGFFGDKTRKMEISRIFKGLSKHFFQSARAVFVARPHSAENFLENFPTSSKSGFSRMNPKVIFDFAFLEFC